MPPRKRAKSSAPVTEVSTLWTCESGHIVKYVAPDGDGNVFVATETCIYKLSGGEVTVVAGGDERDYVDGPNGKFLVISGLAMDTDGCLIVSDSDDYGCIRKVALDGHVSTVTGSPEGDQGCEDGQGTAARFSQPRAVAMDCDGNMLVAGGCDHCIRKVAPDGTVSTLAGKCGEAGRTDGPSHLARFDDPHGVAVDVEGNVLVADTDNHCIRKIARDGVVSTLAGSTNGESDHADGAGVAARFHLPMGIAVDIDGTIVVADFVNCCIRKVTAEGVVSTLAGPTDMSGGSADGPANSTARFDEPIDVAIDENGNVLVADRNNKAVRMITHTGLSRGAALPRWPVGKPALATNLLGLLDDERFADVSFDVSGTRIHAHRSILAARSDYFSNMFGSQCREAQPGAVVTVGETTPAAFKKLLAYLYSDVLELDDEVVVDVMRKAQEFALVRAYNLCMRHCVRGVSSANAIAWLVRAEESQLDDLRGVALGFVLRHFRRLRAEAPATLASLRAHPDLMLEVMEAAI